MEILGPWFRIGIRVPPGVTAVQTPPSGLKMAAYRRGAEEHLLRLITPERRGAERNAP